MVRAKFPKESFLDLIKFIAELSVKNSNKSHIDSETCLKPLVFQMYHQYFQNPNNDNEIILSFEERELEAVFNPLLEYFIKLRTP